MTEHDILARHLTRRDVLRLAFAVGGVGAASALLAACGVSGPSAAATAAASVGPGPTAAATKAGGKLVIGAFEDGAITVFKKIIPLFEDATGTKVELLTEPYDSFFAKAFQDGSSKAGQFDI